MTNEYIHMDRVQELLNEVEQLAIERITQIKQHRTCVAQFVKAWGQLESAGVQKTSAMAWALDLAEELKNNE